MQGCNCGAIEAKSVSNSQGWLPVSADSLSSWSRQTVSARKVAEMQFFHASKDEQGLGASLLAVTGFS
jgi:hypothetical protein